MASVGGGGDSLRVVAMLLPGFVLMGLETLLTVHAVRLSLSFASAVAFPSLAILTAGRRVDAAVCAWQLVNYLISPAVCYLKVYLMPLKYTSTTAIGLFPTLHLVNIS